MKLLITGGNGQIGWEFTQLHQADCEIIALSHTEFDITNQEQIAKQLSFYKPDIVINTAAYTAVDKAEQESELALKINRDGARFLAQACAKKNLPLIHLSTDYVFAGTQHHPYQEADTTNPINVYGESKLAGEIAIRKFCNQHIVLRVSGVFGVHGHNFVKTILRLAQEKEILRIVADQVICPTPAAEIAKTIISICKKIFLQKNLYSKQLDFQQGATNMSNRSVQLVHEDCELSGNTAENSIEQSIWGTYHYCSANPTNWYKFAETIITLAKKYSPTTVKELIPIHSTEYLLPAKRPAYSVLDCSKLKKHFGITQCSWQQGLEEVVERIFYGCGL